MSVHCYKCAKKSNISRKWNTIKCSPLGVWTKFPRSPSSVRERRRDRRGWAASGGWTAPRASTSARAGGTCRKSGFSTPVMKYQGGHSIVATSRASVRGTARRGWAACWRCPSWASDSGSRRRSASRSRRLFRWCWWTTRWPFRSCKENRCHLYQMSMHKKAVLDQVTESQKNVNCPGCVPGMMIASLFCP